MGMIVPAMIVSMRMRMVVMRMPPLVLAIAIRPVGMLVRARGRHRGWRNRRRLPRRQHERLGIEIFVGIGDELGPAPFRAEIVGLPPDLGGPRRRRIHHHLAHRIDRCFRRCRGVRMLAVIVHHRLSVVWV
jgi:hypothetical protein